MHKLPNELEIEIIVRYDLWIVVVDLVFIVVVVIVSLRRSHLAKDDKVNDVNVPLMENKYKYPQHLNTSQTTTKTKYNFIY